MDNQIDQKALEGAKIEVIRHYGVRSFRTELIRSFHMVYIAAFVRMGIWSRVVDILHNLFEIVMYILMLIVGPIWCPLQAYARYVHSSGINSETELDKCQCCLNCAHYETYNRKCVHPRCGSGIFTPPHATCEFFEKLPETVIK